MRQESVCPGGGMQPDKHDRLKAVNSPDTGNRCPAVTRNDVRAAVNQLGQKIVSGAVKIFNGNFAKKMLIKYYCS